MNRSLLDKNKKDNKNDASQVAMYFLMFLLVSLLAVTFILLLTNKPREACTHHEKHACGEAPPCFMYKCVILSSGEPLCALKINSTQNNQTCDDGFPETQNDVCLHGLCQGEFIQPSAVPSAQPSAQPSAVPSAMPSASGCIPEPEVCDGLDNDCDTIIDNDLLVFWYPDMDGDGYGNENANSIFTCGEPPGPNYVNNREDCDDNDTNIHPGAIEIPYDTIDQDCDGYDPTDVDGDGFDAIEAAGDDCDDLNENINPGAEELCNGLDDNCDTNVDEDPMTDCMLPRLCVDQTCIIPPP